MTDKNSPGGFDNCMIKNPVWMHFENAFTFDTFNCFLFFPHFLCTGLLH